MGLCASWRRLILSLIVVVFQCASAFGAPSGKVVRKSYYDFGLGYFSNLNSRSMVTVVSGGLGWNIDPQFDLILAATLGFSFEHNDARFLSPQIKARYMFDPEANSSWYAGGGMGVGYGANHAGGGRSSDSVMGLALNAALGYKAFRKGNISLFFELEHSMIMREAQYGTPILTAFKIGVLMP